MTTPSKEERLAQMDDAAENSREEFNEIEKRHSVAIDELGVWWRKNFQDAGHKRLANILMHKPLPEK